VTLKLSTAPSKYREPKSINWKFNFKILMDSVEDYARQWANREKEDLDTLSEWVKSVRSLIQIRILKKLSGSMSTRSTSIFKDPNVAKHLSLLHDKYIIVSVDKAPNNIVFVCKSHYIDCLIKELGIDNSLDNPTYTPDDNYERGPKSWTIIGLFYVPLEFQPKMKNWIYHHSTGFLNYTSVLSNSVILLGLPNAPRDLFPNY
jgi:hypothetical protein